MALTVAELSADLGINTRPFDTGLKGIVGKFGKLGPMAAAGGAAIAAGIAMGGKALLDLGDSFDNAFDTIRVGTGATGAELAGLQKDFKAVFADVPTDMASVGTAIADLNTRLGLTGKPLQDLAKQFLDGVTKAVGKLGVDILESAILDEKDPNKSLLNKIPELALRFLQCSPGMFALGHVEDGGRYPCRRIVGIEGA